METANVLIRYQDDYFLREQCNFCAIIGSNIKKLIQIKSMSLLAINVLSEHEIQFSGTDEKGFINVKFSDETFGFECVNSNHSIGFGSLIFKEKIRHGRRYQYVIDFNPGFLSIGVL